MRNYIEELIELARRPHFWLDEDNWYSCPKAPDGCADDRQPKVCNCGAEEHNKKVEELAELIRKEIE